MINKEDLIVWLNDPCTQKFVEWMSDNKTELKAEAVQLTYDKFALNQKVEKATALFGMCKGIESILNVFDELNNQLKEESKGTAIDPDQDAINGLLTCFNGEEYESQ